MKTALDLCGHFMHCAHKLATTRPSRDTLQTFQRVFGKRLHKRPRFEAGALGLPATRQIPTSIFSFACWANVPPFLDLMQGVPCCLRSFFFSSFRWTPLFPMDSESISPQGQALLVLLGQHLAAPPIRPKSQADQSSVRASNSSSMPYRLRNCSELAC